MVAACRAKGKERTASGWLEMEGEITNEREDHGDSGGLKQIYRKSSQVTFGSAHLLLLGSTQLSGQMAFLGPHHWDEER